MKVIEMNDKEKSVMLARLCGWHVDDGGVWFSIGDPGDIDNHFFGSLYWPKNMPFAWLALNWAMQEMAETFWNNFDFSGMCFLTPFNAQRAWLDKILELAIEAGLIDEPK